MTKLLASAGSGCYSSASVENDAQYTKQRRLIRGRSGRRKRDGEAGVVAV